MRRAPRPIRSLAALAAVVVAAAAGPREARAGYEDRYGFSGRGMALGNAMVALADDFSAAYHNPAALGFVEHHSFSLGFVFGAQDLDPRDKVTGELADPGLLNQNQVVFGAVADFEPDFGPLRLALSAAFPSEFVTVVPLPAPRAPKYVTYSRSQEPIVEIAVGYKVTDWLAVGVGGSSFVGIDLTWTMSVPIEITSDDDALVAVGIPTQVTGGRFGVPWRVAPTAGVYLQPLPELRVGLAFREKLEIPVAADVDATIGGTTGLTLPFEVEWTALSHPRQLTGGLAYDLTETLTLAFELTWYNWRSLGPTQFRFTQVAVPVIPLDDERDLVRLVIGKEILEPAVRDVFTPRFGLEWRVRPYLTGRAGYFYDRSGYSNPDPTTEFLDTDRHVVSVGFGATVDDPFEVEEPGRLLSIDGFFQYQFLATTESASFRHEGDVISIGASASYSF